MKKIYKLVVIALIICFSTSLKAQTSSGTLTFKIGEVTHSTTYSGTKRVLSIWIERNTTGTTWTFVKTLFQKGRNVPANHTPTWTSASGSNVTGTTTATSSTSSFSWAASSLQTVTWDGTNTSSVLVTDGNFRVAVEECWDHGGSAVAYFPFTKGATAVNQTPTNASFSNMTLTWAPVLAADTFVNAPEAVVYPIPSKGIFNIDLKSDVKNIQVVDITGKVIYNEEVEGATTSTTEKVDLSTFNDGVYFINVSDDNKTSTYKVLLQK